MRRNCSALVDVYTPILLFINRVWQKNQNQVCPSHSELHVIQLPLWSLVLVLVVDSWGPPGWTCAPGWDGDFSSCSIQHWAHRSSGCSHTCNYRCERCWQRCLPRLPSPPHTASLIWWQRTVPNSNGHTGSCLPGPHWCKAAIQPPLPSHPSLTRAIHHRKPQQMRSFSGGREWWSALSSSARERASGVQSLPSEEFVTGIDVLIGPLTFTKTSRYLDESVFLRYTKLELRLLCHPLTTWPCTPFHPFHLLPSALHTSCSISWEYYLYTLLNTLERFPTKSIYIQHHKHNPHRLLFCKSPGIFISQATEIKSMGFLVIFIKQYKQCCCFQPHDRIPTKHLVGVFLIYIKYIYIYIKM